MRKCLVLLFGLLCVTACPLTKAQTGIDPGSQEPQQNPSTDCSDEALASGTPCSAQQQDQQPRSSSQFGFPGSANGTDIPIPATLGPTAPTGLNSTGLYPDNNSLNSRQANGRLLYQQFPPEPPTEFQRFVAETTGQWLQIYGGDLFRRVPTTFSPNDQAPVPPTYVIGPDDELHIRIWGQINFSGNVRVDRSGNIDLPQIGTIPVIGLKFSDLDQRVRSAVARLYRNFDLSVEIGRIRSIQIYISGQARRPGAYTISSLSTLVDAVFATGGPSPQGSLRHILLKREGKTITDFDLYALLIHGDKSKDVHLLPEDVLYIPPAGSQVAITGSVRKPGIYEVRAGETIGDLLDMAGKTSAIASNGRISVDRIDQQRLRQAIEFEFNSEGLAAPLADGDILRILSILPAYSKTVTLRGNVANPGRFAWHEGMRLSDLIPDQDSLLTRDYWWKRSHLGLPSPEFEPVISSLGQNQQPLESTYRGLTTSVTQQTLTAALTPGDQQADQEGNQEGVSPEGAPPGSAPANYSGTLPGNTPGNASGILSPMQRSSNGSLAASVTESASQNSGQQTQKNRVTLAMNQINWNYAVIERVDPKYLLPSLIPFDLGKLVLGHDASQNMVLEPGDAITVFSQSDIRVPLDQQVKYIELEGEFVHPGYYSIQPGETLRDVVLRAGGLTPRAYLYGSEFTRESARHIQQQRLDDYTRSLTLDAERGTQALAVSANSALSSSDVAASQAVTQQMITRLSQVKATGRIVLQFRPNSTSINDVPALSIENGDKFIVPFAPANVNVVGAVYDQNSFLFSPGRTLAYYLRLAGGSNRNADRNHAFLIRADGSVVSRNHVQGSGFWKESFDDVKLYPGDTLVVPDKTLRPTALRNFMDWSQLFSQMALGAAAIHDL